ncbi:MAG: hypothetical protein LBG98_03905 [Puniceicoccales bacterium]|jgi:hypothetical protein|nr:hypothetical protein [Puniceicoccales bacterium]
MKAPTLHFFLAAKAANRILPTKRIFKKNIPSGMNFPKNQTFPLEGLSPRMT